MSLICLYEIFDLFIAFTAFKKGRHKVSILRRLLWYISLKMPPYYIYKEAWNLDWCQRPNSSVVERPTRNQEVPGSRLSRGEIGNVPLPKKWRFFLLIEKTLGNVSPCFELAFSLSFKELGSRNLKAKLWKIYIHSQIFQNYEGKNYPLTVIPVSIHRKLQNQLKFKNKCEWSLNTNWR